MFVLSSWFLCSRFKARVMVFVFVKSSWFLSSRIRAKVMMVSVFKDYQG